MLRSKIGLHINRPLVKYCIIMITGMIIGNYLQLNYDLLILLKVFILILIFSCIICHKSSLSIIIVCFIIFLSSILYLQSLELKWQQHKLNDILDTKVNLSGRIIEIRKKKDNQQYLINDLEVENLNLNSDRKILIFNWNNSLDLNCGDYIRINTKLYWPKKKSNPGGFSYRNYLKYNGIYALANIDNRDQLIKLDKRSSLYYNFIFNLRKRIRNLINFYFKPPNSYILRALVSGDKYCLPVKWKESFRSLGLGHLLVISGFHIGLLSYFFNFICQKLKLSKLITLWITIAFLICYVIIIVSSLPAVRAVLLISLVLLGKYLKKDLDLYNLLAGVGIVMLIINPWSLFTISFQLSFITVIIIFYITPLINKFLVFTSFTKINNLLSTSIAIQLGLLPILAYYFNQISLTSIMANLLIIPLISLILILTFPFILFSILKISFLVKILVFFIQLNLYLILDLVKFLANNLQFNLLIAKPNLLIIVTYYVIIYCLIKLIKPTLIPYNKTYDKKIMIICVSMIIILLVQVGFSNNQNLKVIFFDVNNGDAIYLQTPSNQRILVDGGSQGKVVENFLKQEGINNLDFIFISHFHQDHVGGILSIIKQFTVNKIYYPPTLESNKLKRELLQIAGNQKIKTIELVSGDIIKIGSLIIRVLAPQLPLILNHSINNNSLVLQVIYENFKLLLPGDLELEGEDCLLANNNNLSSTVLKVGHHGGISSSSKNFLNQIAPQLAVISVGDNNYRHPNLKLTNRLNKLGVNTLRTDKHGAIILKTDGVSYRYATFLD